MKIANIEITVRPEFNVNEMTRLRNAELVNGLTLSSLTFNRHLHPLQAANFCRNSGLVVGEDD